MSHRVENMKVDWPIRDLEWEGWAEADGGSYVSACPWCGGARLDGHGQGCELARALAEGA